MVSSTIAAFLLGDLIHLVHRRVDFLQAGRLFMCAGGDFGDDIVDVGDLRDDALQRLAGFGDEIDPLIDLAGRSRNQALDFLRGPRQNAAPEL